jgi:hypothetical protein
MIAACPEQRRTEEQEHTRRARGSAVDGSKRCAIGGHIRRMTIQVHRRTGMRLSPKVPTPFLWHESMIDQPFIAMPVNHYTTGETSVPEYNCDEYEMRNAIQNW